MLASTPLARLAGVFALNWWAFDLAPPLSLCLRRRCNVSYMVLILYAACLDILQDQRPLRRRPRQLIYEEQSSIQTAKAAGVIV